MFHYWFVKILLRINILLTVSIWEKINCIPIKIFRVVQMQNLNGSFLIPTTNVDVGCLFMKNN